MKLIGEGVPFPLGATCNARGVNFALFSEWAERVELCLFDRSDTERRIQVLNRTADVWHVQVGGVAAGQAYGYRVYGPWDPDNGQRFNPAMLLQDPYARRLSAQPVATPWQFDFRLGPGTALMRETKDNASQAVKSVVVDEATACTGAGSKLRWSESILYELHVKGMTRLHPDIEPELRGRYGGLGDDRIIEYLKGLGITTVELMPVQEFVDEPFLLERKLVNYWGYNPVNFFTPTIRYAREDGAHEFRAMVQRLHDANIEVIMDVVYNHTGEAGRTGPTFNLRGIDNRTYYRMNSAVPGEYINDSGCGNSLNVAHPAVLRLVMDSLRYWVRYMGVDGFRFDLATSLGRTEQGFSSDAAFFQAIHQDPVLSRVTLIAEPWDLGPGGYRTGQFPKGWSEWNDQYRDTVRRFWRGDEGVLPDLARQLHGASHVFEESGRPPQAGINFITSHDGFTLADLVSYESKHNEANLESNRDGHNANYAVNCGVEGPTSDPVILRLREKQARNFVLTLMISQGVPMLLAGDELRRTKSGNNNSYCQDNEMNWIAWQTRDNDQVRAFHNFVASAIRLRQAFPELRCERFIHGRQYARYQGLDEIDWYHPRGTPMQEEDWRTPKVQTLGLMLHGHEIFRGATVSPHLVLIYFNQAVTPIEVIVPPVPMAGVWREAISSSLDSNTDVNIVSSTAIVLEDKSVSVFVFIRELKE